SPLTLRHLDGKPFDLRALHGRWIMMYAGPGECDQRCSDTLFAIRQIRLMTGKNTDRVERVWLVTDDTPLSTQLMREYDGMWMLRANLAELKDFLPLNTGTQLQDHIWLIDPLGNLMMRFPK